MAQDSSGTRGDGGLVSYWPTMDLAHSAQPSVPRVIHPSDRLTPALLVAGSGLSMAKRAGFSALTDGVRASVLASERLVQVLELLVDRGFSPRGASSPVPPSGSWVPRPRYVPRSTCSCLHRPRPACFHRATPRTAAASASSSRSPARWQGRA